MSAVIRIDAAKAGVTMVKFGWKWVAMLPEQTAETIENKAGKDAVVTLVNVPCGSRVIETWDVLTTRYVTKEGTVWSKAKGDVTRVAFVSKPRDEAETATTSKGGKATTSKSSTSAGTAPRLSDLAAAMGCSVETLQKLRDQVLAIESGGAERPTTDQPATAAPVVTVTSATDGPIDPATSKPIKSAAPPAPKGSRPAKRAAAPATTNKPAATSVASLDDLLAD